MKTKPLTFLLALTFLFLFSGSVYGEYDPTGMSYKMGGNGVFTCKTQNNLFLVDMNEKTITRYTLRGRVVIIYKIVEENEVRVKGNKEGYEIILHKHSYMDKNAIEVFDLKMMSEISRKLCFVGDKKF